MTTRAHEKARKTRSFTEGLVELIGIVTVIGGLTAVAVVGWAHVLHDPRTAIIDDIEHRYEITVSKTPGQLTRPGDWRIDGQWRRCVVDRDGDTPALLCAPDSSEFVGYDDLGQ